jgi:hypothetical protein
MYSWFSIIPLILSKPPHVDVTIPSHIVPDPEEEGFKETLGEFQGQVADYVLTLNDGRRIHVRKFGKSYKAHWDKVSPSIDFIGHLRHDAPHWWIILCCLGGAGIGYLFSEEDRTSGALSEGAIGFLLALSTLP